MADDATPGGGGLNLDAAPFAPPPLRPVPTRNAGAVARGSAGSSSSLSGGDRSGRGRGGKGDSRARGSGRGDQGHGTGNSPGDRNYLPNHRAGGGAFRNDKRSGAREACGMPTPSFGPPPSSSETVPSRGGKGVRADFLLNFRRESFGSRDGGTGAHERFNSAYSNRSNTNARPPFGKKYDRRSVFRRELFLAANFRFLVADWADLAGSCVDPDHELDWDDVISVEQGLHTQITCPICLENEMTAPQVTVCGHSFCFPCVARHAVTNRKDGDPAKCPLCFAPLRLADLRHVRRRPIAKIGDGNGEGFDEGGQIRNTLGGKQTETGNKSHKMTMSLVSRARDSAVPVAVATVRAVCAAKKEKAGKDGPHASHDVPVITPINWPRSDFALDAGACDAFAKYTLTRDEFSLGDLEMKRLEKRVHFLAREGGADAEQTLPYVLLACDAMQTRVSGWAEKRARFNGAPAPVPLVAGPARRDALAAAARAVVTKAAEAKISDQAFPGLPPRAVERAMRSAAFLDGQAVQAASAFSDDEDSDDEETPNRGEVDGDVTDGESVERSKTDTNDNVVAKGQPTNPETRTETYYWYQSEDGQPVVLHSVCLKLLTAGLGGYDALPVTISAPVLCAEKWTQTLETRKRMTHLRHLPLTTEFTVVELDLHDLVGADVMRTHGGEVRARAKVRKRLKEDTRRKAAKDETFAIQNRRARRVFDAAARANMPAPGANVLGGISSTPDPDDETETETKKSTSLSPSEALCRARALAAAEDALCFSELQDAKLAIENAEGPRGTSFARVAGLGFASGLDAPTLRHGGLDGDAFGPALGATNSARSTASPGWGPGVGRRSRGWGPNAENVLAAAAEAPGKKKGKKKLVLSLTGGGGRRY